MKENRKFWTPISGVVPLGDIYKWIKALVNAMGYSNVEYDPVFDAVGLGDSVEVAWIDRLNARRMISFVRVG